MNTDLHQEEYPRLVPPTVVYEDKDSLKKPAVIPLYVKIISAAAAVALLFGIFWRPLMMPQQQLLATMQPIQDLSLEREEPFALAESQAHFIIPKKVAASTSKLLHAPVSSVHTPISSERIELPLLAELHSREPFVLPSFEDRPELLMPSDLYYDQQLALELPQDDYDYDDDDVSLLRLGFLKMTEGQYDGFGSMLQSGWRSFKGELAQLNESVSEEITSIKQLNKKF